MGSGRLLARTERDFPPVGEVAGSPARLKRAKDGSGRRVLEAMVVDENGSIQQWIFSNLAG